MASMTLEEALAAATVDDDLITPVNDVIMIDPETRTIIVPESERLFGVEEEQGVERKYFKCPRIVGNNIDLFANRIYISYIKVLDEKATISTDKKPELYWCYDVAVDETGNYITFSWELSGNVLNQRGLIGFAVIAKSMDGDVLKTRWKTTPAIGTVKMSIPDGSNEIINLFPDIISQLLNRMDAVEEIATEEAMKGYVAEYMEEHPVQLDPELKDNTKAAPAGVVGELKGDIAALNGITGSYHINLVRGYHNTYNGKVILGEDESVTAIRLTSGILTKSDLPVGTKIVCSGTVGVRIWYCKTDETYIGYSGFEGEITITNDYGETEYDHFYLDFRDSAGTALQSDTDKITIIPPENGLVQIVDELKENVKAMNNVVPLIDKRTWTIHKNNGKLYKKQDGTETQITGLSNDLFPFGSVYVPSGRQVYRREVTDMLFEKCTWLVYLNDNAKKFAFGTRDKNGDAHGCKCIFDADLKTLSLYNSDWNGNDALKATATFNFDIYANEKYSINMVKTGSEKIEITICCTSYPEKTVSISFTEPVASGGQTAKMRAWGGVAFESIDGTFYLLEMGQKADVDEIFDILIIGDSFVDAGTYNILSQDGFAYLCRKELGKKCFASGHGGSTSSHVVSRLESDASVGKYKYAFIHIGSNDSISTESNAFDNYKSNILTIIEFVKARGAEPILTTIPIRADVDNSTFASYARTWIPTLGYKYVDEYKIVRNGNILPDGIHANANGNKCIFSELKALIPECF